MLTAPIRHFMRAANMINGTFTLPAVFTKRETRLTLINYGDVPTGLRITITSGGYSGNADSSILITNHSTGAYMRLKYDLLAGEALTVDSDVFSIRKNGETNALHYLEDDDESDFFQLARGANDIEITTNYAENVFEADVAYYESFAAIEV